MPRIAGVLLAFTLCLSIALMGANSDAFAVSELSVKVKIDGRKVAVDFEVPKYNSSPVYKLEILASKKALSGKGLSEWIIKKEANDGRYDTIIFSTKSKPILPGESGRFTFISTAVTIGIGWYAYDQNSTLIAKGNAFSPLLPIYNRLVGAARLEDSAFGAIVKGDFDSARVGNAEFRDSLFKAREEYKSVKKNLTEGDRKSVEAVLNYYDKKINMTERAIFAFQERHNVLNGDYAKQILDKNKQERHDFFFDKVGLTGNALVALADELDTVVLEAGRLRKDPVAVSLINAVDTDFKSEPKNFKAASKLYRENGQGLAEITQEDRSRSLAELPSTGIQTTSGIVSDDLARLFTTFDKDGDKKIDLGEAQAFYYWMEQNILYRYDDENEKNPVRGTIVGDGREGRDYRQTPSETYKERAGDCEDTATLEQAFYDYFGATAYVVGVNTIADKSVDHAATIVLMAETKDSLKEAFGGGFVTYTYSGKVSDVFGNSAPEGTYILIDNAYSDAFGYLSNGLEEGAFQSSCIVPLEQGYGDEWAKAVVKCAITFN